MFFSYFKLKSSKGESKRESSLKTASSFNNNSFAFTQLTFKIDLGYIHLIFVKITVYLLTSTCSKYIYSVSTLFIIHKSIGGSFTRNIWHINGNKSCIKLLTKQIYSKRKLCIYVYWNKYQQRKLHFYKLNI